eukprot:jgi/Tetstr1/443699/TSEL_031689.t1
MDNIDLYIRKRREELEALLVDQLGTKWQEFYKLGGTGEEPEAVAVAAAEGGSGDDCGGGSGGGAASGGIEAGPACNHVSPAGKEHRSTTHMPRWVLRSFAKYPHVLHAMLDDMGHNGQVEENAKAVKMKHWRENAVKMFTDTASTSRAWKRLRIYLLSHTKDHWALAHHLIDATGMFKPPRKNGTSSVVKLPYADFKVTDDEALKMNAILSGLLGQCGCSSKFPCIYCLAMDGTELALTLLEWIEAGIRMRDIDELEKLTHTVMGSRCPSGECTYMIVNIDSLELTTEGVGVQRRRLLQRLHWGICRGRSPYIKLAHILDYVVDILHLMLRVIPQIFMFTVSKHCDTAKLMQLLMWQRRQRLASGAWPCSLCPARRGKPAISRHRSR